MIKSVNGATFRRMILSGSKTLSANKDYVDSLNVFPVPDGDTGTNMSMTIASAAREVSECSNNSMASLCAAFSKGALKGARGNSGVITSQIVKGITDVLSAKEEFTAKDFANALSKGTEVAYKAVTKPKEGTILSVVRAMSEAATSMNKRNVDFSNFLTKVIESGEEMLKKTPEMLPVLKKAGVVDAGGRGLLILFQGFNAVFQGEEDLTLTFDDTAAAPETDAKYSEEAHFDYNDLAEIQFAYCTEFFIVNLYKKTTEADIDRFREMLMQIGDCVLVIGDLSMVKVHVHSNQPGEVLTAALKLGELDNLKIENMLQQNRKLIGKKKTELKPYGIVSVCAGEGISAIFKELMCDSIIEGGQTMNPSADDIAKACDKVNAKDIFVFPNNKNIILAAEQAKALSNRKLHIIPSRSVPQGLAALLAFDPDGTVAANEKAMTEAMDTVKSGAVTYAVRSTEIDNLKLNEGDIIGMDAHTIVSKGDSVSEVAKQLVEKLVDEDSSCISLYFGNNVTEEEANAIAAELSEEYPDCDVDCHFGGQPLYYYLVSVE
ncbi:MAG: DAK2 domain-containing protein [Firmicutes bacterium]|nr:DAK2 domain-containing protein [Bacillota bacterium]MDY5531494.1 DAK2 domain-containing protein [Pumilibacteraceae bacterium]